MDNILLPPPIKEHPSKEQKLQSGDDLALINCSLPGERYDLKCIYINLNMEEITLNKRKVYNVKVERLVKKIHQKS